MIGIIGAMEQEVAAVLKYVDIKEVKEALKYKYYYGLMGNKEVVVLQGGIGKVNTGIALTYLFTMFDIDYIINVGSAGGLNKDLLNVGDVVIGEKVVYHDVDVTQFGYPYGQMAETKQLYFESNADLVMKCKNILGDLGVPSHVGLIASGDSFIARSEQVEPILNHFSDALCSEMEAAAVAQVCTVHNIPFVITRGLSDVFGKGDSAMQFDTYLEKASASSALMAKKLVESL